MVGGIADLQNFLCVLERVLPNLKKRSSRARSCKDRLLQRKSLPCLRCVLLRTLLLFVPTEVNVEKSLFYHVHATMIQYHWIDIGKDKFRLWRSLLFPAKPMVLNTFAHGPFVVFFTRNHSM